MTDKQSSVLAAHHPEQPLDMVGRWYMLNKMGMATLCTDKEGAEQEAADAQRFWPHMGPHRAVQLVEAADVDRALRATQPAVVMLGEQAELRRLSDCCPELNLSNYGPDDVDELNGWAIEVSQCIDRALAAQPAPAAVAEPSDEMVLAAARVLSPGLFRHGLDPQPKDGPHTTSRMRKEAELFRRMLEAALAAAPTTQPAPQQEAQEPVAVPRFNCWSTNEGDSWFDHPADSQAIYDCLGNNAKVGDEYELTAGWESVTARYRITEVVGDGEDYEVECISHPQENTAPQPSPAAQGDALDTMRLDWLDADESRCVFHLGKSWYTRPSYGLPYRKRASLREAIDAARKEMP